MKQNNRRQKKTDYEPISDIGIEDYSNYDEFIEAYGLDNAESLEKRGVF